MRIIEESISNFRNLEQLIISGDLLKVILLIEELKTL